MAWLGEAAPGYTASKPTPEGHAPPAAYTAEQSDTRRMCDIAINFINSQVSCSSLFLLPLLVLVWLGLGFRTGRGRRRLRRPRQIRHDLLLVLVRRRLAAKVQSAADHECGPLHGR